LQIITSFRTRQRRRTEAAYQYTLLFPGKRAGEIRVVFKAYGSFAVSLFDGAPTVLTVSVCGSDVPVPGMLHEVKSEQARGTEYEFVFRADRPEALQKIRFRGLDHFSNILSNIHSVEFELHDCKRRASNPFFEMPS
jgi:hypothetical protein